MGDLKILGLPASAQDEDSARAFLERLRWPDGPICPHCRAGKPYRITPKPESKRPARKGLFKCRNKNCRKQFTVTVGTIFEDSRIPLHKWLMSVHFLCSSKKGMSALQLSRMLGVTYKTAWFMCHRIRLAMKKMPFIKKLEGVVEVDETWIGGKKRGLGVKEAKARKSPVMALVERGGNMRAKPIRNLARKTLHREILGAVSVDSTIMTDEFSSYQGIGERFLGGHETVNHSDYEYVRGNASTNTVESFFALLKRGIHGTFHHVSPKHLHRYTDEFAFRWNSRKVTDEERSIRALQGIGGKRLHYRRPTNQ
jgi:transposase-like protein